MVSALSVDGLSVTSTGPGRRKLLEASIDTPRDGGMIDAWAVRVRGHLLRETLAVREIAAVVPGLVLATAATGLRTPEVAARHPEVPGVEARAFTLLVDTLGLPQAFAFHVRDVAERHTGDRLSIESASNRCADLDQHPIQITYIGDGLAPWFGRGRGDDDRPGRERGIPGSDNIVRDEANLDAGRWLCRVIAAVTAGG